MKCKYQIVFTNGAIWMILNMATDATMMVQEFFVRLAAEIM